ncbi:hypothetical protein [Empedobacter brevis]|uniref:Uncharacterized protein n=1 Tax=Empedobacter brevis NBRC 14943 = ATCC 43319 TaxID=1218108 RepID=A0A511NFX8_9FLAO|nr:hypothetical protein [Empedobacter brevis]GEM51722.1 hypothetical protein EB1_15120 [Empedobacter brevis NBRC 14943 = ATCC 43319]
MLFDKKFIILIILFYIIYFILTLFRIRNNKKNNHKLNVNSDVSIFKLKGLVVEKDIIPKFKLDFSTYNLFIRENIIYITSQKNFNPLKSLILSSSGFFENQETETINELYFDKKERLVVVYYPYNIFSFFLGSNKTKIILTGFTEQEKFKLKNFITTYISID